LNNTSDKINSISGSNKRKYAEEDEEKTDASTETDDFSTDSEIDNEAIDRALEKKPVVVEVSENGTKLENYPKVDPKRDQDLELDHFEPEKETTPENLLRKSNYVHVERSEEVRENRAKLPIITEEQVIMEKIFNEQIVIICGETGSGKTTQIPQFLYEAGFAQNNMIIGVTEPRRVAAISMSKRVAYEMNLSEKQVSYQIRYEGNYSPETRIKFMTDGVLLKEVQMDFMLSRYSVIVIDEAHERSVYTDILIGLLSRIVPLRNKKGMPLKLIVMSATLRVQDFTENARLFKQIPPVINVESRQFPVSIHFNKHTYDDYLSEAYKKICKIHRKLPEGGILVFVTGQQEVQVLSNKLKKTFPILRDGEKRQIAVPQKEKRQKKIKKDSAPKLQDIPKINLDNYTSMPIDEESEIFNSDDEYEVEDEDDGKITLNEEDFDDDDDSEEDGEGSAKPKSKGAIEQPMYVLPLFSLLSSEKQAKVFDNPPEGCRLCVVATNVAETSLTIPNIKYVVDCGKVKMKFYDKVTGVSTFQVVWTSKASGDQRAGRAGRTAPGHCYRLYSSAVYNDDFKTFSEPEIVRKPVEDLILQMKDLGIDRIYNFPFPTPPDESTIQIAENLLIQLGALEIDKAKSKSLKEPPITRVTSLGKTMASFPVNPRYSKMLTLANQHNLLPYVISMISGLSVQELFIEGGEVTIKGPVDETETKVKCAQLRQSWIGHGNSLQLGDIMMILVALGAVEYEGDNAYKFCEKFGIRFKAINEVKKLRKQLTNTVNSIFPTLDLIMDPKMRPPTQEEATLLRQIVLSGMVDRIAKKYDHVITNKEGKDLKNAYQGLLLEDPIFIHPSSVLFKELPEYICYLDLIETSKMYMKGVCTIENTWLPVYLGNQCAFEKPEETPPPRYDSLNDKVVCHRKCSFGKLMWPIKAVEVEFPMSVEKFKWFAQNLLEGLICEGLKKYSNALLASPSTMLKSWAKLQPRTEKLLSALASQSCDSRAKLLKLWEKNKDYLRDEYLLWIPESLHFEITFKWPPINGK